MQPLCWGPLRADWAGQDSPDVFPAFGLNAYLSGANVFFADGS